ncbi:helix-turn-helix transcriptional regulator [Agromyces larvae]|uniref:WYL domain-containing protein n=1 Tax=Agromyces larvae TaxID=2929802 RepID=A0ABY4C245_9MICO|nr:WYL domain-containing protein [Agromyces larvae]UOE45089.1 WYL domain-containing protein [Agromyces larvae]
MPGESSSVSRIEADDRLFSLVLALIATEHGLLKTEILSTVRGYAERYDARPGRNANLERQFERDKEHLRELGIPLETIESPDHPGDNQLLRYRIRKGRYELPESVRFTPDEIGLLGLAAEVWREASLSEDSQRALTKLRALGIEPREPLIGYAPRLRVRDAAFDPLRQALDRHQTVRFRYLRPGSEAPRERTVDPYALVLHEGRWHVHGHDRDLDAPRTFLLRRITGPVTSVPNSTFDPPEPGVQDRVLAELEALRLANVADLEVDAGSDAEVRLGRRAAERDGRVIRLHYTDEVVFADELASYGPEVRVIAPESLRARVRDRLAAVVAAHREEAR